MERTGILTRENFEGCECKEKRPCEDTGRRQHLDLGPPGPGI